jgi:hypothetical protein
MVSKSLSQFIFFLEISSNMYIEHNQVYIKLKNKMKAKEKLFMMSLFKQYLLLK